MTTVVAGLLLAAGADAVQARDLRPKDLQMCKWGAETARGAQQSKLAGVSLWSAHKKIQTRHYS
ncbi:hypothetical protein [Pseudomonas sp. HR96]|uniref:hypothetical protein n=1 Tax=Pseudomonas sp. HR96 TaxID=1027966 RepID=UPI0039BE10AF